MSTYRTGNHWGVTIVHEGVPLGENGATVGDQLVAVVVNGDQALAERICALLNADEQPKGALVYDTTKAIHKHLRLLGYSYPSIEWDGALAAARAYVDSCTCTIVGPHPDCPVHHGRRARGPKPPPVGPGCTCDGSGRTCPRHGAVI